MENSNGEREGQREGEEDDKEEEGEEEEVEEDPKLRLELGLKIVSCRRDMREVAYIRVRKRKRKR